MDENKNTVKKSTATALNIKLNLSEVFVNIKLIVETINPNNVTRMRNKAFLLGETLNAMMFVLDL